MNKQLYHERKRQALCVKCGKFVKGCTMCHACNEKVRRWVRKRKGLDPAKSVRKPVTDGGEPVGGWRKWRYDHPGI